MWCGNYCNLFCACSRLELDDIVLNLQLCVGIYNCYRLWWFVAVCGLAIQSVQAAVCVDLQHFMPYCVDGFWCSQTSLMQTIVMYCWDLSPIASRSWLASSLQQLCNKVPQKFSRSLQKSIIGTVEHLWCLTIVSHCCTLSTLCASQRPSKPQRICHVLHHITRHY